MSIFEEAIDKVLSHEGCVFTDDPKDHGGATRFGISIRYLLKSGGLKEHPDLDLNHDGKLDWRDIKLLTRDKASALYREDWWDAYHYGDIDDQKVATKVFDMAVNFGAPRAHKLTQEALNYFGFHLEVDGCLGPVTFAAIKAMSNKGQCRDLRDQLTYEQQAFYRAIVAHNPDQRKWLAGWLRRAADC
jgi:lysozyme family protein